MRVNARAAERGYLDALLAPFVRADQAEQLAQRHDRRRVGRAVRLFARGAHVGGAAQADRVIGFEPDQQHAERAGALRLGLAMQVERVERRRGGFARLAIRAAGHRLQQLPRILEIASPKQPDAFARLAIGDVGRRAVVGDRHALRRRIAGFGTPAGGVLGAGRRVGPGQGRMGGYEVGHEGSRRVGREAIIAERRVDTIALCRGALSKRQRRGASAAQW